jgi:hypothetical protein
MLYIVYTIYVYVRVRAGAQGKYTIERFGNLNSSKESRLPGSNIMNHYRAIVLKIITSKAAR